MLTTFSGRKASQDSFEIGRLLYTMQGRGVTSFLEIGARHGDTGHFLMSGLTRGSKYVGVDLPGGLWGTEKSRPHLERVVADLNANGYKASCLFGDSQTDATRRLIVGRGPYDAALIDGDHTLAGVTRDWHLYGTIAPMIAFHDIVGDGQAEKVHGNPVEVPRLWADIKASGRNVVEFIAPGSAMGIGVVFND